MSGRRSSRESTCGAGAPAEHAEQEEQQHDDAVRGAGETSRPGGEAQSRRRHTRWGTGAAQGRQGEPPRKLGQWQEREEALLLKAIKREREQSLAGKLKWPRVGASVPQRSHKQCRERWVNQVSPAVIKYKWTCEEDALLLELGRTHLRKWTEHQVKVRCEI